jgi:hypothetical protein
MHTQIQGSLVWSWPVEPVDPSEHVRRRQKSHIMTKKALESQSRRTGISGFACVQLYNLY